MIEELDLGQLVESGGHVHGSTQAGGSDSEWWSDREGVDEGGVRTGGVPPAGRSGSRKVNVFYLSCLYRSEDESRRR